jgi:hypothetical protein
MRWCLLMQRFWLSVHHGSLSVFLYNVLVRDKLTMQKNKQTSCSCLLQIKDLTVRLVATSPHHHIAISTSDMRKLLHLPHRVLHFTTTYSSSMRHICFSNVLTQMSGVATLGGAGIMASGSRARITGSVVYTGLSERATLLCGGKKSVLGSSW